ncbi:MAG: ATP-grasp domain-containing protein, partial [Candidatus Aenigmatarchaeota archaeon]
STSENMRLMGNKIKAREIVSKAGVPVLPGSDKPLKDEKEAFEIAKKIGFPVVIKAALGGGGRGMKVVHSPASFINAFLTSQSEAMAAFGDSEVYVEKYIEGSRHIEIQIMADRYGNIVHLGERDCTIQRRHQKILEEAPSPVVNEKLRIKMGEAAVSAARQVNYTNVGTVEFLLTPKGEFYFLEMNTRIQVEHPVTEMVTGIDIVKEQIRIAYGDRLRYRQKDIIIKGHAMECRINAEDPERFIPSPGIITKCYHPGGIGVRVDSHIMAGQKIPPYYDSLISKLIVHAENRQSCISRMKRALGEYIIEGVKTNIPFHLKLLSDPDFIKGNYDTKFIEKKYL